VTDATRFVQIHTLTGYPAVLLNRDDAGMAKRLPYGGASRTRVSSQCLKRHWRKAEDAKWSLASLHQPMAERSRLLIENAVMPGLACPQPEIAEAIRVMLARTLYGKNAAKPGGVAREEASDRQALLLGHPEIEYLRRLAQEAADTGTIKAAEAKLTEQFVRGDGKSNLKAMLAGATLAAGLESALFGRMVTSDPEANTEAAIHVAHSFTVHAEESESDYFTVVDDLAAADAGTAGVFDSELTSGLFYGYVVVDVEGLVDNLGGDRALAGRVVEHLIHLIATVTPGAKRGSTAPYAWAEMMLVELGDRQPRSLAAAFRRPVPLRDDVLDSALAAMGEQLASLERAYGTGERRVAVCTRDVAILPNTEARPLDDLAGEVAAAIAQGAPARASA